MTLEQCEKILAILRTMQADVSSIKQDLAAMDARLAAIERQFGASDTEH